ncbi:ATPase AAA [Pilimelia anulata]|uniref:ATPase AAA n=1 Tax=Pilimelia anulata TaxID=53371 RepID=A0A8J3BGV7_9ACTN|nr:ATP-binding protein [Pilimelia anulata]GGK10104.1 ATPase AAA [Pilimelia anulata]
MNSDHLWARLGLLADRVDAAVDAQRRGDPSPDDPFRGLVLGPADLDRLRVPRPPAAVDADRLAAVEAAHAGPGSTLDRAAAACGLSALDVELLLVALLPDVDDRYERSYAYLQDDVSRRRPAIGLALRLCGQRAGDPAARYRFAGGAPLLAAGLLVVDDPAPPFLGRPLRVPDEVAAHLLAVAPPAAAGPVRPAAAAAGPPAGVGALAVALRGPAPLVYLHEQPGGDAAGLATAALAAAGRPAHPLDLDRLAAAPDPAGAARHAVRSARLRGAGLVAGPVEALDPPDHPERGAALRLLVEAPVPVLLTGARPWDPARARRGPLALAAPALDAAARADRWTAALAAAGAAPAADLDAPAAWAPYRLGPARIRRAAEVAAGLAAGAPVTADLLRAGVRAQNGTGLARLARAIEPGVDWSDLVLPDPLPAELRALADRVRHRDRVLGRWRMRPGGGRGRGVLALFAGESGTGKTMSAEVLAADLGLPLYVVDLATVVDKYVGETEKNLERIFVEAADVNGVLLFDEADAVFGKRAEVKDAHDRYANVASAYLLQRLETFDGVAILTTNLRANVDDAFIRRLDVVVDFPVPDAAARRALWERSLRPPLPLADDVDPGRCADRFPLAGGSIRACAITAAYRAAAADRPVAMADLLTAVHAEYRKLGRLTTGPEFTP